ncbi:alpha/beta fold hydrolase [Pseudomonas sp. NPDC077186]|uniref:alpha/beta fold hydrolase n=1 Tax=Pseudomonas sp. NPDC077186 TaxID=3364421 RepID=UPI0037CC8964
MHAPVVFIHGLIGTLQLPELSAAFVPGRFLAPDLLGYGALRQVSAEAIDLPAQVAHLHRVIEAQFPGEAVHLLGHSVGGAVAMLFAQAHGERVRSLVSVEGNFSLDDAFWSAAVARMSVLEAEAMLDGFRADPAAWLTRAGVAVDARSLGIAERWLAQQPASTLQAMARSVVALTAPDSYRDRLRRVFADHPVHLLAGARSRGGWHVPAWAERAAASQTLIEGSGHLMMLEQPQAFLAAVKRVLQLA